nr:hypothetical protein [Kibdelosporangium sp. MJ126-NF4]
MFAAAAPVAGATPTTAPRPTPTTAPTIAPTTAPTSEPTDVKGSIKVTPGVAKPGQKVTVTLTCLGPTGASNGKVVAPVLTIAGFSQTGENSPYVSAATVKANTKPGTYPVGVECYGYPFKTTLKVVGDNDKQQAPTPQVKVKPKGAAQTGGGATAL